MNPVQSPISSHTLNLQQQMDQLFDNARQAKQSVLKLSASERSNVLSKIADKLELQPIQSQIISANEQDMRNASNNNASSAVLDRLKVTPDRLKDMAISLRQMAAQEDVVNKVVKEWTNPENGLNFQQRFTPFGTIAMIYEARPNVTIDAAGIGLKSGNLMILRPGSNCYETSAKMVEVIQEVLQELNLPQGLVQIVPTTDRDAVGILLKAKNKIDLIIPRGGKSLTSRIDAESKVPTLLHLDGNNTTYIDKKANLQKAIDITVNAKLRRTGICGASENVLIHESRKNDILPQLIKALTDKGCEIRGDEQVIQAAEGNSLVIPVTSEDWDTEYLDSKIAMKIVGSIDEAIEHINTHGSKHSEAIITEDPEAKEIFINSVDSAILFHNASTQNADGGIFGYGAEIGIATGKVGPRGPVGPAQLGTLKNVVLGDGAAGAIRKP